MSLKWWEKTVEYKFILMIAKNSKQFIAPLDGNEEIAGDALFSLANKWVLIEFKKNHDSIVSEKAKFTNYHAAHKELASVDAHHHIVFGFDRNKKLELSSKTYFSNRNCNGIEELLSSGTDFVSFSSYIKKFTSFKKVAKYSASGVMNIGNYSLVAGVNSNNEIVECSSLNEFQRELGLELGSEHTKTREYGGFEL